MDRAHDRGRVPRRSRRARRSRGRSAGPRTAPSSCSARTRPLPYGAKVLLSVDAVAESRSGVALAAATTATFTVSPSPPPSRPARPRHDAGPKPATEPRTKPIPKPPSGGGGAVNGNWAGVESYYLRLMNCTRTGGWVTSGRQVLVARRARRRAAQPQQRRSAARRAAVREAARHPQHLQPLHRRQPGRPPARARASRATAGPRTSAAGRATRTRAVLGSHLLFQSERPYNGGHYREPHELGASARSASGSGCPAAASGWWSTSTPP